MTRWFLFEGVQPEEADAETEDTPGFEDGLDEPLVTAAPSLAAPRETPPRGSLPR